MSFIYYNGVYVSEEWEVEYFVLPNGKFPGREWLLGLKDELSRAKVDALRVYFYRCETSHKIITFLGSTKSTQKRDLYRAKKHLKQWRSSN